jgi:hypothetical protein
MLRRLSIAGVLAGLCLAGSACTVQGQVRSSAYVSTPELVLVEPGVYVVADYSQPVFYTDGYYWLYRDGYWLRSYTYSGSWVRVRGVPYHVRRIHQPRRYVHYRPRASARVYYAPTRRGEAPRRVDRRYQQRAEPRRAAPRDHRDRDRRDHRDRDRDRYRDRRDNRR